MLWKKVEEFNLDNPMGEYCFSVRLAAENCWTINFTSGAIQEYKKFMFLAATSEFMISPSEIVDVVWHQHLVFTQSYTDLCNILGRKIEHFPSTRNKDEYEKFRKAKERTMQFYKEIFGQQPTEFWNYTDIYQPLAMPKAKMKIRTLLAILVFACLVLLAPLYYVLKPEYIQISGSYFLMGYFMLSVGMFSFLDIYNRDFLDKVVRSWKKNSFVFNLSATELIYMKHGRIEDVVHAYVNHMVDEGSAEIERKNKLKLLGAGQYNDAVEFIIAEAIKDNGDHGYRSVMQVLRKKPAIKNLELVVDGLKKYIIKSRTFSRLFTFNFIVIAFVFLLGATRVITGISREKPVGFLLLMLVAYTIGVIIYIRRLEGLLTSDILPGYYEQKINKEMPEDRSWDWKYFIAGSAVLATGFMPLYRDAEGANDSGVGGSSGSSCGSSCGGGCGGGCGGCGGG